jgi:glutathione S-transferase
MCDIEAEAKKIGAPSTGERDGRPLYTLPFIYDPATRTAVSDSQKIVAYLEEQYPVTPTLFPPRTRALQAALTQGAHTLLQRLYGVVGTVVLLPVFTKMPPRSQAWYRARREHDGVTMEQMGTFSQEHLAEKIDGVLKLFDEVDGWIRAGDKDGMFLTGDEPSNADVSIASGLILLKILLGEQHEMWKAVAGANGGRWVKYIDAFASRNAFNVV